MPFPFTNNQSPVILTIDDEKNIRESIRNFLEDYDYSVLEADNGRVGLDVFRSRKPDLILVDLRMPEINGLEVLAAVTQESPDTPIIVVSGTGAMADAVEALRLGAWDYVLKPIRDLSILLHAIEKSLERAQLMKENREYKQQLEEKVKLRTSQLEKANQELSETRMQIIRRLAKAAEYKDNETGKHVIRVGIYAGIIAQALEMEPETVELIRICSPMHDLGKIGIPDRILQKPGPLEPDEWEIMQNHCSIGFEMLNPIPNDEIAMYQCHTSIGEDILGGSDSPLLEMARIIAAYHHEHWDGSGYPNKLKGEEIPIPARIVTLVDIYDALSSKRSYKNSMPEEKCLQIIRQLSGTYLDPKLVNLFFENLDKILRIKEEWKD